MWEFPHSFHPAKPAQPASPASQASHPASPDSQASWASKPQASRHRCQQFFFIGAPARFLRAPQAGSPPAKPAKPSQPARPASQPAGLPMPGQAGQAGLQASWHRFLRPPGLLASILEASGLPGLEVPPSRLGYLDASNHRTEEVGGRGGSL